MTTPNIDIVTTTTISRDEIAHVLITALWQGKAIQIDVYRASDMAQVDAWPGNGGEIIWPA